MINQEEEESLFEGNQWLTDFGLLTDRQKVYGDISVMKVCIENPSDSKKVLFPNRNIGKFSVIREAVVSATNAAGQAAEAANDLSEVILQNTHSATQQKKRTEKVVDIPSSVESTVRNTTPPGRNDTMVKLTGVVGPRGNLFRFSWAWKILLLFLLASLGADTARGNTHVVSDKRKCAAVVQNGYMTTTYCCDATRITEKCVNNLWGQKVVTHKADSISLTSGQCKRAVKLKLSGAGMPNKKQSLHCAWAKGHNTVRWVKYRIRKLNRKVE